MAIEGFDYKEFATSMSEQAKELVPAELQDFEKEYIVKTLGNFTMLAGEALYNDTSLNLDAEQAVLITQIIAEWSFHKSIDLVHSGILPEYWDSIMQKIAFTIFEIAKQAVTKKIPQEQLLQVVEHHVVKVYKQSIEELKEKGIISEEIKNRAESQSNIDAMAQAAQQAAQQAQAQEQNEVSQKAQKQREMAEESARLAEEKRKKREADRANKAAVANAVNFANGISHKQLKLMSLALVMKILSQDKVTTILNKFEPNDSKFISQYMNMADLESHIDGDLIVDCLKEIKDFIPSKRKLTKENVVLALQNVYANNSREKVEKIIKNERPLIKRFIAKTYDNEYGELPLKIAGIVTEYVEENI
ncbi:MAG: hypothetical protein MJ237_04955 [bacterium]|nr:hypothetical protein [bacterium]